VASGTGNRRNADNVVIFLMKISIDLPDDLYRRVKSKSALEGKAVREVATALFTAYADESAEADGAASRAPDVPGSEDHNVESWLRAFH